MTDQSTPATEFTAIQTVYVALEPLTEEGRNRVLNYVADLLGVTVLRKKKQEEVAVGPEADEDQQEPAPATPANFGSFAELFDAAQPGTASEKAVVGAYWLQICQGGDSFDAQRLNTELKHLGHGVANITTALDTLKNQNPALVLQLKKSGTSQQARKTYKLTVAGVTAVKGMING